MGSGATLTLDPGAVLKGGLIVVAGALSPRARPPSRSPSPAPTTIGRAAAWPAATGKPAPGDWNGLVFNGGSSGTLDHVAVRDAGADVGPTATTAFTWSAAARWPFMTARSRTTEDWASPLVPGNTVHAEKQLVGLCFLARPPTVSGDAVFPVMGRLTGLRGQEAPGWSTSPSFRGSATPRPTPPTSARSAGAATLPIR